MNKELLISIKPEHLVNILNGKKTLELRKIVPKDYKGWVNIYCTKRKKIFRVLSQGFYEDELYKLPSGEIKFGCSVELMASDDYYDYNNFLNGKVVARFWFDDYIAYKYYEDDNTYFSKRPQDFCYNADEVLKRLCLSRDEFKAYGKGKDLYAWHIKNLEIFETPKRLSDFYVTNKGLTYKYIKEYEEHTNDTIAFRLKKAPQSWRYVYYAN